MKRKSKEPPENTRVSGQAVYTKLSSLPDRFTYGPHTRLMSEYLSRRWSAHSYGWFSRSKSIMFNQEFTSEHTGKDRYRWVEHPSSGLRFVGKAHEIRGSGDGNMPYFDRSLVEHNGWYTDNYQNETVWGEVYQLPARDGKSIYVPSVSDPNNDGACIDFRAGTEDLTDAIRWSDSMAEKWAEEEREYQAKDAAETRKEEIKAEITQLYADFKALARETRANCKELTGMPAVIQLIREEYRRVKCEVRSLRKECKKLDDNYWDAVPQ